MAAELIRSIKERTPWGIQRVHIYKCCGCGTEVTLYRKITGMDTYCGVCSKKKSQERFERKEEELVRSGERNAVEKLLPKVKDLLSVADPEEVKEQIAGIVTEMEAEIN